MGCRPKLWRKTKFAALLSLGFLSAVCVVGGALGMLGGGLQLTVVTPLETRAALGETERVEYHATLVKGYLELTRQGFVRTQPIRVEDWLIGPEQVGGFPPLLEWRSSQSGNLLHHTLRTSVWVPVLTFAAAPLLALARYIRRRRLPPPGHCLSCGYNLTGNTSGRCPECGTAAPGSDPGAPTTVPPQPAA